MRPHPRIRKTAKWTGAAVTMLLIFVWLASGWWWVGFDSVGEKPRTPGSGWWWSITIGRFNIGQPAHPSTAHLISLPHYRMRWKLIWERSSGMTITSVPGAGSMIVGGEWKLQLPLWIPTLLVLAPTAGVWWLDARARRRRRLNRCWHCDYDRAGIAGDAKCPECGKLCRP